MTIIASCIGCHCNDLQACHGGCHWLRVDYEAGFGVCSKCPELEARWDAGDRQPRSTRTQLPPKAPPPPATPPPATPPKFSKNDDRVMALGKYEAIEATTRIAPMLLPMNQRERVLFFSKWLAVTLGHMNAAIGNEAARGIVDTLKYVADGKLESPEATDSKRCIKYERRPELDKRIANGDDYAGDAWVRWVVPGHTPEDAA